MQLTFMGAAGTVTGSKYLLSDGPDKFLIDCGLFQGQKEWRLKNWEKLPFDPESLSGVILTHAHLDHSGYLPRLVRDGFRGPIYCSEATFDLCRILLPDSGYIQEEDAARANRYNYTKHAQALPLYTAQEAEDCLQYFKTVNWAKSYSLKEGINFSLHRAGHILGAASVHIDDGNTSIAFSGDIGRFNDPLMKPPVDIEKADYLVVESTYGDRLHTTQDPLDALCAVVLRTIKRGGSILIPAFAVGRAQTLLYCIYKLKKEGRIPSSLPVYLDSPMAIDVSELMQRYLNEHKLATVLCRDVCHTAVYTPTVDESKALNQAGKSMPKIIISASGMATGGRVLHHLKHMLGDPKNTVLLAGFQAAGTRGDRLLKGEKEIKIHGSFWPVQAEVAELEGLSAHADYEEILHWLGRFKEAPRKTFITHGEPEAARHLQERITNKLGWESTVPAYMQTVLL